MDGLVLGTVLSLYLFARKWGLQKPKNIRRLYQIERIYELMHGMKWYKGIFDNGVPIGSNERN